jgi:hypothetical protein
MSWAEYFNRSTGPFCTKAMKFQLTLAAISGVNGINEGRKWAELEVKIGLLRPHRGRGDNHPSKN